MWWGDGDNSAGNGMGNNMVVTGHAGTGRDLGGGVDMGMISIPMQVSSLCGSK